MQMWPPMPADLPFNSQINQQLSQTHQSRRRTFNTMDACNDSPTNTNNTWSSNPNSMNKKSRTDWEYANIPSPPQPVPCSFSLSNNSPMQQAALQILTTTPSNSFQKISHSSPTSSVSTPNKAYFDIFQRKTPPKLSPTTMDVQSDSSSSNTPSHHQCWSCLKSKSIQTHLQLTKCSYCEHTYCIDSCLTHCERCYNMFCVRCYMTDYSQICERKLCVDCYYYDQQHNSSYHY